mgnify:CR=1 FL=1
MVSFNKYGERDSFGITYVLENAQAPPVAGASRRGADEEQFLLKDYWVNLGTYEDSRGFERSEGATPYWPGGLRSWVAPPDRVNMPEGEGIMGGMGTPAVVVQEVFVESPTSKTVVIVVRVAAVVLLLLLCCCSRATQP